MKIALYIAFQNKSSIDCSKEIIDLVSDNNQLVVDSKLKDEIDKNKSMKDLIQIFYYNIFRRYSNKNTHSLCFCHILNFQ